MSRGGREIPQTVLPREEGWRFRALSSMPGTKAEDRSAPGDGGGRALLRWKLSGLSPALPRRVDEALRAVFGI